MTSLLKSSLINNTNCSFFESDLYKISHDYQIFRIVIGVIMSSISFSAILGNFIVLLAMFTNKQLRTV